MSGWTPDELARIGSADELGIASRRADGTLRRFITIWAVRVDADVYVRSAYGPNNPWFRRAVAAGQGRIRSGGVERDVSFEQPDPVAADAITAAYHTKYDRYGPAIVGTVVSPESVGATLRLVPR